MLPSSRDNLCHHNNPLIFETIRSCICCRLAMLMHNTEPRTNTADFSQAWLNITNSYLGIIATLPVFPQPSPCLSTPLSPLSSALVSRPKQGSKNSGELNSHNNMRLSGDQGSNVCAGQHEGSDWQLQKGTAMRMTVGICSCVRSLFLHYSTFVDAEFYILLWQRSPWKKKVSKKPSIFVENKSKVEFLKIIISDN